MGVCPFGMANGPGGSTAEKGICASVPRQLIRTKEMDVYSLERDGEMESPTLRCRLRDSRWSRWQGPCARRFSAEPNLGVWHRLRQEQYGKLAQLQRQGELVQRRLEFGRWGEGVRCEESRRREKQRWELQAAGSGEGDSFACLRSGGVLRRAAEGEFEAAAVEDGAVEAAGQVAVGEDDRLAGPRLASLSRQRPYCAFPFLANECDSCRMVSHNHWSSARLAQGFNLKRTQRSRFGCVGDKSTAKKGKQTK
jgi:hypothetical protein